MTVPGSNLLATALTVIGRQTFFYYRFLSRSLNPNGQDIPLYASPLKFFGSLQPVPRNLYEQNGLDLQKEYITVFVELNTIDIARDVSGDLLMYRGQLYQLLSNTSWFQQDGWNSVICVKIPNQSFLEKITPPKANSYVTGDTLTFEAEFNQSVVVTGVPQIDIMIGSVARAALYVSGTQVMLFAYTVVAEDAGDVSIPVVAPATAPSIDLANGTITGTNSAGANVNFVLPNMAGVTANV